MRALLLLLAGCQAVFPLRDRDPEPDSGQGPEAGVDATLPNKLIFATRGTFDGNLGGFEGADAKCGAAAMEAGLGVEFRAWISTTAADAAQHMSMAGTGYRTTSGQPIAGSYGDLTDGILAHAIDADQFGDSLVPIDADPECPSGVWTATAINGQRSNSPTCSDWKTNSAAADGLAGDSTRIDLGWTSSCPLVPCSVALRLYCIQQ